MLVTEEVKRETSSRIDLVLLIVARFFAQPERSLMCEKQRDIVTLDPLRGIAAACFVQLADIPHESAAIVTVRELQERGVQSDDADLFPVRFDRRREIARQESLLDRRPRNADAVLPPIAIVEKCSVDDGAVFGVFVGEEFIGDFGEPSWT